MSSPAEVIYQWLLDQGYGTNTDGADWESFISFLPDEPDNAICVLDTAGRQDGRLMSNGERIEHKGIQIQLRGVDYAATWDKANTIATALDAISELSVAVDSNGTYTLHNVSRAGTVIPIGIEQTNDRRRNLFTINATVTISEA